MVMSAVCNSLFCMSLLCCVHFSASCRVRNSMGTVGALDAATKCKEKQELYGVPKPSCI